MKRCLITAASIAAICASAVASMSSYSTLSAADRRIRSTGEVKCVYAASISTNRLPITVSIVHTEAIQGVLVPHTNTLFSGTLPSPSTNIAISAGTIAFGGDIILFDGTDATNNTTSVRIAISN